MAMTASLAANPTTVTANGPVLSTVNLTVSNSAGAAVAVTGIRTFVYAPTGTTKNSDAATVGTPVLNGNNNSVPNGGSVVYSFLFQAFGPRGDNGAGKGSEPATETYDVGCEVTCADGTVIYPTVVTITANPTPHS